MEPAMVFVVAAAFAVGWLTGAMRGTRPTHSKKRRNPMSYKVFRRFLKTIYFHFIQRMRTHNWYFPPQMDLNGRIAMAYFS